MGGGKGGDTGDLENLSEVQERLGNEQAKIAREYLAFSKQQYVDNQEFVSQVLDVQLPAMREQLQSGREDRAQYEKYFAPLERQMATAARAYDTPERREREASKVQADVAASAVAARENAARQLEGYGVDPSMTRAAAIDRQIANTTAAQQALAGNQERQRVEQEGYARRTAAVNLGRGFPAQSGAGYGSAVGAGSQAVGTQLAPQQQMTQGAQVSQGFYGGANNALQGASQTRAAIGELQGATPWLDAAAGVGGIALGAALAEEGGVVEGPDMSGKPSGQRDIVPVIAEPGEYIVPAEVVRRKGIDFFENMVERTRRQAIKMKAA